MSRLTEGKRCNSRNFRAHGRRFEIVRQINLRHEDRRAARLRLRGNELPGDAPPFLAKENLRRRARTPPFSKRRSATSPKPSRLERAFEIIEIELPGTPPRHCAATLAPRRKGASQAGEFPRR